MTLLVVLLISSLFILAWLYGDTRCDLALAEDKLTAWQRTCDLLHSELNDSERIRADLVESAKLGAPAVWWPRPGPIPPGADPGYWPVMIGGKLHKFTTEALAVAAARVDPDSDGRPV